MWIATEQADCCYDVTLASIEKVATSSTPDPYSTVVKLDSQRKGYESTWERRAEMFGGADRVHKPARRASHAKQPASITTSSRTPRAGRKYGGAPGVTSMLVTARDSRTASAKVSLSRCAGGRGAGPWSGR
jgi:hypothetical protein